MAAILNLTDGTTTIDFVPASDYILLANGLELALPDVKRTLGGDPFLGEGERLVDRQYANREIVVNFKIEAADHNTLISDIRTLVRMLDVAKKTAVEGFGPKVTLHYKLNNATDEMVFDVLDGELTLDRISSTETHRASILLKNELVLICKPFAHLSNAIKLSNYLLNPGFEWNPAEGGIENKKAYRFTASDVLKSTSPENFRSITLPARLAAGAWINLNTLPSALTTLMLCGSTIEAYRFTITAANKLEFVWYETDGTSHTVTAEDAFTTGIHHIAVTLYTTDDQDTVLVLFVDGKVQGTDRDGAATGVMREPTGNFYIGAEDEVDTEQFDGWIYDTFIISGPNIFPNQIAYLHRFGMRGIFGDDFLSPFYWGLEQSDILAAWPMDENSGDVIDKSGNGNDLTVEGATRESPSIEQIAGWTVGADAQASDNTRTVSVPKHGLKAYAMTGAGSSTHYIKQTLVSPADHYTVTLWAKISNDGVDVILDGDSENIPANGDVYKQYIKTFSNVSANAVFQIGLTSGVINTVLDSIMVTRERPYGTFPTFTEVTGDPKPFIGSRVMQNFPTAVSVNWLDLYDFPGDAPATTRVRLINTHTQTLAPIRIGASFGQDPWKQIFMLQGDLLIPDFSNDSAYETSGFPDTAISTAVAVNSIIDRVSIHLPTLFPITASQFGSFKLLVSVERTAAAEMITLMKMKTAQYEVFLSGDPILEDTPSGTPFQHVIDCGILNWPPEIALTDLRAGKGSGHQRLSDNSLTPKLIIANTSDIVIAAPGVLFQHLWIMPVDGGYYTLAVTSTTVGLAGGISQEGDEILVIDTIENESGIGYIEKELDLPEQKIHLPILATPDISSFGSGFKIEPNKPGVLVFQVNILTVGSPDPPFGLFVNGVPFAVEIEYMPRFLYV